MNKPNNDEICTALLSTIDNLTNTISSEESADMFDIKTDPESAKNYNELKRLRRSLEQYSNKLNGLFYIGFIGHFSAGKSSTINSLFDQVGSQGDRNTGLHPTDNEVTLITDTSNSSQLIGTHNRGELQVGTIYKESNYLKDKVIVDTPGSGDPSIVEEMVRDFLPICDVIVYVINAVMPLDTSDLPVLIKAHSKLPSVPIKFIVTRADEFILNRNKPFTVDNINAPKKDLFISELISRLSDSIKGLLINKEDILLIDNISGVGLDSLESFLSTSYNQDRLSYLHSHKVKYYGESTSKFKKYFLEKLEAKDSSLSELVDTAKDNHENYQRIITITNSKLTENWSKKRTEFVNYKSEHSDWCSSHFSGLDLPRKLLDTAIFKTEQEKLTKNINENALSFCESLERSLKHNLSSLITREKEKFERAIRDSKENIPDSSAEMISECFKEKPVYKGTSYPIPESLDSWVRHKFSSLSKFISNSHLQLSNTVNLLHDLVKQKEAMSNGDSLHTESVEQLDRMFDDFIQSIRLYRSGILALNARELAEKVGIVKAIEKLEDVETEQIKKDAWQRSLNEEMFPKYSATKQELEYSLSALHIKLNELKIKQSDTLSKFTQTEVNNAISNIISQKRTAIEKLVTDSINSILSEFSNQHIPYVQKLESTINEILEKHKIESSRKIKEIRKNRFHSTLKYGISGFVIGSLAYTGYIYSDQPVPNSITAQVAIGLGINALFSLSGIFISKLFDTSSESTSKIIVEKVSNIAQDISDVFSDTKFEDWGFLSSRISSLKSSLSNELNGLANTSLFELRRDYLDNNYQKTQNFYNSIRQLSDDYLNDINKYMDYLSDYYADIDGNLDKLTNFAEMIKEDSILPSLQMFEERSSQIKDKKNNMKELEIFS